MSLLPAMGKKKISHSKQDFTVWYGMVYMARVRAREAPLSQARYLGRACRRETKGREVFGKNRTFCSSHLIHFISFSF